MKKQEYDEIIKHLELKVARSSKLMTARCLLWLMKSVWAMRHPPRERNSFEEAIEAAETPEKKGVFVRVDSEFCSEVGAKVELNPRIENKP